MIFTGACRAKVHRFNIIAQNLNPSGSHKKTVASGAIL